VGRRTSVVAAAILALVVGLVVGALLVDAAGSDGDKNDAELTSVPVAAIGNAAHGRDLWQTRGCTMCHSYGGRGGTDAPALDFMQGDLSVHAIAGMSGTIWDHTPHMTAAFREEKVPFPTIAPDEMADIIAYLHGGPSAAGTDDETTTTEGGGPTDMTPTTSP
jgi:hypothetical protein